MNRTNLIIFILLLLVGAFGVATYFQSEPATEQITPDIKPVPPPKPQKNRIVHYRVPETTPTVKEPEPELTKVVTAPPEPRTPAILPAPQIDDQEIQENLESFFINKKILALLQLENFIQKFVVTIDNLPEKRLPTAHLPIKSPGGKFLVVGTTEAPQASRHNYKRYSSYVTLLGTIDQDAVIGFYTNFYPLFQTSYQQLGYKNSYFNDRLVYVIDHLLETPNPADPIQFAQPAVLYTYADPNLEKLSSGQKVLLRIGWEQRLKVFNILGEFRQKLTNMKHTQ